MYIELNIQYVRSSPYPRRFLFSLNVYFNTFYEGKVEKKGEMREGNSYKFILFVFYVNTFLKFRNTEVH